MRVQDRAIYLSGRPHGENGAVVRLLTERHGLIAAYVNGARSKRLRPLLAPGNRLSVEAERRSSGDLATARVEPDRISHALGDSALNLAIMLWLGTLLADLLPEDDPHDRLFAQLDALTELLDAGADHEQAARALAEFERSLLEELGFGLDLSACAATGANDGLAYVSPKSGRAVSASAASGYERKLFPLPTFLLDRSASATPTDLTAALAITRHFLERDLIPNYRRAALESLRDQIDAHLARLL